MPHSRTWASWGGTFFAHTTFAHMLNVREGNSMWTWIVVPGLKTAFVWTNSPVSETFFVNAVFSATDVPYLTMRRRLVRLRTRLSPDFSSWPSEGFFLSSGIADSPVAPRSRAARTIT